MEVKCPYCGGNEVIRRGKRPTNYGSNQVYWCKTCKRGKKREKGRKFTISISNKNRKIRYPPFFVNYAEEWYLSGLGFNEIRNKFRKSFRLKRDRISIDIKNIRKEIIDLKNDVKCYKNKFDYKDKILFLLIARYLDEPTVRDHPELILLEKEHKLEEKIFEKKKLQEAEKFLKNLKIPSSLTIRNWADQFKWRKREHLNNLIRRRIKRNEK